MKVLVCGETLHLGGAETVSINLANALANRGLDVAYSAAPGPLDTRLARGVRFEATPPLHPLTFIGFLRRFSSVLRSFEPDVLHAQGGTLALTSRLLSRIAGRQLSIVLTHHSTGYRRAPEFLSGPLLRKACDHIIAISAAKYRQFEKMGFDDSTISLIPNFVDCRAIQDATTHTDRERLRQELQISDSDVVVAMIGRMIPGKGFDVFARSVARCAARIGRPLVGLAVGDGPERARLERLVRSLPGPARFVFTGYRRDATALLSLCKAVLFPSTLTEVLPMTLIEASAAGVPIICSDISGNREVVLNGVNGEIAGPSEESYADALARILLDETLARSMAAAGRKSALEKFDTQAVVPRIIALYTALASARAASPPAIRQP
jgi:glycosyltransferase involved in cell wall biosynthesis